MTMTTATQPRRRYGLLLIVLIAAYLLSAFLGTGAHSSDLQLMLITLAGLLALRSARRLSGGVAGLLIVAGVVGSLLALVLGLHLGGDDGKGFASIWTGALLLAMVVLIVRQVLGMSQVTEQSLYGAISAYLIIGLMFSSWYTAMYWFNHQAFFAGGKAANAAVFQYFSFVTLTTLGYGDYTAASNAGRALAVIEAMAGQIFLTTLVAKLVSTYRRSR
jgi:hypothetical protein